MTDAGDGEIRLRLTLDGVPTLADLAAASTAVLELLDAIADHLGVGHIDWVLTDLSVDP